jgi:hypothetical protein
MKPNLPALAAALLLSSALAVAQDSYLDVFVVKVKSEKRSEFDTICQKIAEANRKHNGDTWVANEVVYGEANTVYFISRRASLAEAERGSGAFMAALRKAYGAPGAAKLLQDFNNCISGGHGELRQRRFDLSTNPPADAAALNRLVGESRWIRTVMIRVRPGFAREYAQQLQTNKAALDKQTKIQNFVSQATAGQQGTVFYLINLGSSLSSFEGGNPMPQALGEEGYQRYTKTVAAAVLTTETIIGRFLPELSNAPEAIAAVAPSYWRPKPAPGPAPRSGGAAAPGPKKP